MQSTDAIPATLGGYRLVRSLGSGSRADVLLASSSSATVALKIIRPEVAAEDVGLELAALARVPQAHCAQLVDILSTGAVHPVLVFERVHRGSLVDWLRDRDAITVGEAVTVLAPLASTVASLHSAGVAHTNIAASNVHLGVAGDPVILGFGHAALFRAGSSVAAIDSDRAARSDRVALAALARLVLARVRPTDEPRATGLLDAWLQSTPDPGFEFPGELEARLFDLAQPQPLEFSRRGSMALPGRAIDVVPSTGAPPPGSAKIGGFSEMGAPAGQVLPRRLALRRRVGPLPVWMAALVESSPAELARRRLLPALRTVRRPVWIAAAASAAALTAALVLVPQGGTVRAARPHESQPPSSAAHVEPPPRSSPADPLVALPVLLTARAACFGSLSIGCLDGVDDAASGAYLDDSAAIRRVQGGGELPAGGTVVARAPGLIERLGDTVLVQLDIHAPADATPASILMIRTKAGWRIRSYLTGAQARTG